MCEILIRDNVWAHVQEFEQLYDKNKYNLFPNGVYRTVIDIFCQYLKKHFISDSIDDDDPIIIGWTKDPKIPFDMFSTYYVGELLSFIHNHNNPQDQPHQHTFKIRYLAGAFDEELKTQLIEKLNGMLQCKVIF